MARKIKVAELPEVDVAQCLDNDDAIAQCLSIVPEENDPSALAKAMETVARAGE